ncbi:hypothetical protein PSU4_25220 [Pseudonocardia sulfidoxydans NBRC 16205]|uniref:Uncharacterized protein n=1 Tax=Pseudonocardia sulfidoxydans NBRC 16205 TaxID=1223511 RepID=A0A511DKJ1_9PSEU|nr:hypothetical protein [Pseudonocardia sulfidoxydans]GEL23568.1 hypothetical protein PSU4_25220 [Pseudonocardia sulfidoxydans NBRC 16205]
MIDRFDGHIAGLGTAAGLRVVVGRWERSPLGTFTDVMAERPDGHRLLLAPTPAVAEFVSATYTFDEVRILPVFAAVDGPRWTVRAGPLEATFRTGGRPPLGLLLAAVPGRVATSIPWVSAIDVVARRVLPAVRTRGSAGNGRDEFYCARDIHRVSSGDVRWDGAGQGALAPVDPPVRFGFGSTPPGPSVVRVTTLIRH